jgi:hypothetical protein
MITPKAEPRKKEQNGCVFLLIRLGIGIAVIFVIDYVVSYAFQSAYPHDSTTTALIPFQNHYLTTTDAFVTSEALTSEFTGDVGITARFLALVIIPFIAILLLTVVLYIIPFTKKLTDYAWHALLFSFFMLMMYTMFFPPVMTVFDRERKVMVVSKAEWWFFSTKTEIPFDQISGFSYKVHVDDGTTHEDVQYADLFAATSSGEVFIGENQIASYVETADTIPVTRARRREIEAAMQALRVLIGK